MSKTGAKIHAKLCAFDGLEARLALYSSLIYTFRDFQQKLKIDAKIAPKSFQISFIFAPKSRAHFRNVSKTSFLHLGAAMGSQKGTVFIFVSSFCDVSAQKRPPLHEGFRHQAVLFATWCLESPWGHPRKRF